MGCGARAWKMTTAAGAARVAEWGLERLAAKGGGVRQQWRAAEQTAVNKGQNRGGAPALGSSSRAAAARIQGDGGEAGECAQGAREVEGRRRQGSRMSGNACRFRQRKGCKFTSGSLAHVNGGGMGLFQQRAARCDAAQQGRAASKAGLAAGDS